MAELRWAVTSWRLAAAMWMRAATAYRTSFVLLTAASLLVCSLDFVVLLLMFRHTDRLGGWRLPEIGLLYGTSGIAIGVADFLLGTVDGLGERIRTGALDVLLLRPAPALSMVCAERFTLRRLGRPAQATAVLVWSLHALAVPWDWTRVALLAMVVVCGPVIFGSLFVGLSSVQFRWGEARELQNSLTYGGATLLQYPPTVFARDLLLGVTFGVPLAFVNWLPALQILGRPDPLGLPVAWRFAAPLVAALSVLAAGLAWRSGLRSYRSTGS
ncbi:ABC transporter permease [Kitasatospora sp. NPDC058965]|uniref:ABC transporter permease n=1 Tax=Kitasatospora sp. NPDC058965 TaxID=3346682 RepID=UPI003685DF11